MSRVEPRAMAGALELLPRDQIAFQRFLDTIRAGFERFGFLPVETPVMETTKVLLTKSGGETEKQVYFVQSTGALAQGKDPELALRFDLTVPLARYVAEHENDLSFPFRRYQMQRVYRGERRQRGRFREFYQCDVDVVAKDVLPLEYDAEIPVVIHHVFRELDVGAFTILLNNRKVLGGFLEEQGVTGSEAQGAVIREIDKLDKRGPEAVLETLGEERFALGGEALEALGRWIALDGDNDELLARLAELGRGETFTTGLAELRQVREWILAHDVPESAIRLRPALARGLDYYTGTVYETVLDEHPEIGSVCSGGRYDNLAGHYTKSHLPGVGISIGATRLFDQLRARGLTREAASTVEVFISRLDESLAADYLALAAQLRAAGLNTEVFYGKAKLGKQMKYADRAGMRFAVIMGSDEKAQGQVQLRDLATSDQENVATADLASHILQCRSRQHDPRDPA